jgi:hypothetical protein
MANTALSIKNSIAFWPSSIQRSNDNLHADMVAKLLVLLQKKRRRLPNTDRENLSDVCTWLIEGLYQSYFSIPNAPLALPLSYSAYGSKSKYNIPYGYRVVKRVYEAAKEIGLIDVVIGTYVANGEGTLTRLRPAGRLLKHFDNLGFMWRLLPTPSSSKCIFLNPGKGSANRQLATVKDLPSIALMQENLFKINSFLGKQCISIDLPNIALKGAIHSKHLDDCDSYDDSYLPHYQNGNKSAMSMQNVFLHRVFAQGSMSKGGRFYGAWWQQIPSKVRCRILINQDKTVECDFSGLACAMLYAMEGLSLTTDAYDIGLDFSQDKRQRPLVKRYLNAVLNDSSKKYTLKPNELEILGLTHAELHDRLSKLHAPIAKHFNTGVGVELQCQDSEIAQEVMLRLMDKGEVCLPIHDSFIVRVQAVALLYKTMHDVFQERFKQAPGIKPEFGYKGVSMAKPRRQILAAKQLNIVERFTQHLNDYSVMNDFYVSWERANYSNEDIEARCRALNYEHGLYKELGLFPMHLHKFYGLPLFI